jgi:hypothetical protein
MTSRVESHLAALSGASKVPGIQYVVVTPAGVVFEHASGWADIRRRIPVDGATTMMAYSMRKTIPAVAVLQLRNHCPDDARLAHQRSQPAAVLLQEGGGGGFHCMMRLYPGDCVGTVAMTNATGFDVAKLLDTIDPASVRDGGRVMSDARR